MKRLLLLAVFLLSCFSFAEAKRFDRAWADACGRTHPGREFDECYSKMTCGNRHFTQGRTIDGMTIFPCVKERGYWRTDSTCQVANKPIVLKETNTAHISLKPNDAVWQDCSYLPDLKGLPSAADIFGLHGSEALWTRLLQIGTRAWKVRKTKNDGYQEMGDRVTFLLHYSGFFAEKKNTTERQNFIKKATKGVYCDIVGALNKGYTWKGSCNSNTNKKQQPRKNQPNNRGTQRTPSKPTAKPTPKPVTPPATEPVLPEGSEDNPMLLDEVVVTGVGKGLTAVQPTKEENVGKIKVKSKGTVKVQNNIRYTGNVENEEDDGITYTWPEARVFDLVGGKVICVFPEDGVIMVKIKNDGDMIVLRGSIENDAAKCKTVENAVSSTEEEADDNDGDGEGNAKKGNGEGNTNEDGDTEKPGNKDGESKTGGQDGSAFSSDDGKPDGSVVGGKGSYDGWIIGWKDAPDDGTGGGGVCGTDYKGNCVPNPDGKCSDVCISFFKEDMSGVEL